MADNKPATINILIERGRSIDFYAPCHLPHDKGIANLNKLLEGNFRKFLESRAKLQFVPKLTKGFNISMEFESDEAYNPIWRTLQVLGMVGTLGLYSPSRTFQLQLSFAVMELEVDPPEDASDIPKNSIVFVGEYSKPFYDYDKILFGKLLPYHPDNAKCDEVSAKLNETISEVFTEFEKDLSRSLP